MPGSAIRTVYVKKILSGIAFRIKMEQSIDIGSITEFTVVEIRAMLDTIHIDGEIFSIRHVVDNGTDFCEIYGHWQNFHDLLLKPPVLLGSGQCRLLTTSGNRRGI